MKKIMFNDKYSLTQAVLDGRKTMTRRMAAIQPPYKNSEICFPTVLLLEDEPEKHPLWLLIVGGTRIIRKSLLRG